MYYLVYIIYIDNKVTDIYIYMICINIFIYIYIDIYDPVYI